MASDDLAALVDGAVDLIPEDGLRVKLGFGRPLRVKLGVDPSRPDLTLGHAVVLGKLRQFQDAGHVAVLIIGDFTARIGDPSGASDTRPMLSKEDVRANAQTYLQQAERVIDVDQAEIRGNAEWLGYLDMGELIRLASTATLAQMLEREDFRDRYRSGKPISVVELLYPLMQGYDSVAIEADVELGGTDQTFNLLMGREVQRAYGQDPQVVLTLPLLEGLDGVRKMSKSLGNYVGLTEPADEMFGKLMSIPDGLIARYELLCAGLGEQDHGRVVAGLHDGSIHPNEEKRRMARAVVDRYHGLGAGASAESHFDVVHKDHELPEVIADIPMPSGVSRDGLVWLPRLLVALGRASSNAEARRLVEQGGVRLDGEVVTDPGLEGPMVFYLGKVLQVGRRWFGRLS